MQELNGSSAALVALWLIASIPSLSTLAQTPPSLDDGSPTAFTYQGFLNDGAKPANGLYDLQFALYDKTSGGDQLGNFTTNSATAVSNGLFTLTLDFGNQFSGGARWLQISVRTNGPGAFVTLAPRQALTPIPYAIEASSVAAGSIIGSLDNSQLPSSVVTNGPGGVNISGTFSGAFSGNGAGLTNAAGSAFLAQSNGVAYGLRFTSPVSGLGTNQNLGEVWATDFGFGPTNTPAGNSSALDQAILVCSNNGGGIIRYGARTTSNPGGGQQIIGLAGEHLFPPLGAGQYSRIVLKGDRSAVILSTETTTTHGVFWGRFDADCVNLRGTGTNASDVYPYTNYVGMYEVGFFNPHLKDVNIVGFGQGLACCQLGSYTGALAEHVDVENSDIGIALGDACDAFHLINTSARGCIFGLDSACCVPIPTNNAVFTGSLGSSYGSTNVISSRSVYIDGGIWAYNQVNFVLGKAQEWRISNTHIEVTGQNIMWLGHTNPMYHLAYETGSGSVYLENNTWTPNGYHATNIVCNAPYWVLHCRGTIADPAYIGIYGQLQELDLDSQGIFGTNKNYFPNASAPNYYFNELPLYYVGTGAGGSHTWMEDGSDGLVSSPAWRFDVSAVASAGITAWTTGDEYGDRSDASRVSYILNGRTNDEFKLSNVHLKSSAGVGSTATSTAITMGTTGITNITSVNWRILGFTGTSVTQKNMNDSTSFSRNTITTATDITLQPNEALVGTGCAALAVRPW